MKKLKQRSPLLKIWAVSLAALSCAPPAPPNYPLPPAVSLSTGSLLPDDLTPRPVGDAVCYSPRDNAAVFGELKRLSGLVTATQAAERARASVALGAANAAALDQWTRRTLARRRLLALVGVALGVGFVGGAIVAGGGR